MNSAKTIEVLDVEKVELTTPQQAVKTFSITQHIKHIKCDVLIVGGGTGGVAAAIKLSEVHPDLKVCLTEETDWLGGQMTAQGVSALDENYLIETSGACKSYQTFRKNIRAIYQSYVLSATGKAQPYLNPGTSWVTYLAFEPKLALKVIDDKLSPAINSGALQIFLRTKAFQTERQEGRSNQIKAVAAINLDNGEVISFAPKICLDATELGDLLPLAGVPYRVGSDSRSETGEPHTPDKGDKENVQDFVYPFVVDFKPGTSNTIEKPAHFDEFNDAGKFSFNGYKMFEDSELKEEGNRIVPPFWTYRRLIAKENFDDPLYPFDVAMINWDSNDLRGQNIIDQKFPVQAQRLALAKTLSLGFLYWMQTLAPRDEGGVGYPELELRTDVLGTTDGLSKYPYIRESRRVIAKKTIVEQDIVASTNPAARAKQIDDALGIGLYPVDIHGMQEVPGAAQSTKPFQLPMSALIPEAGGNILPACKNIGVTHLTNGAYRLHPVEWAIGEAQAELAAYCLRHHLQPEQVLTSKKDLRSIQHNLILGGSPCVWFDDLSTDHPDFCAIQYNTISGLMDLRSDSLHSGVADGVTVLEALSSLCKLFNWQEKNDAKNDTTFDTTHKSDTSSSQPSNKINDAHSLATGEFERLLAIAQRHGYLQKVSHANTNLDDHARILTVEQLTEIAKKSKFLLPEDIKNALMGNQINRGQFARWLYGASKRKEKH